MTDTNNVEYEHSVAVNNLNFFYQTNPIKKVQVLFDNTLNLKPGDRCILLGANGAGKSTLLSILAGKHLVDKNTAQVLGKAAFYQTLGLSGVSYLGNSWTRTIAFCGTQIPYQADIPVSEMMQNLQEEYPERRDHLMELLEIDPTWKMHLVSDGQRRRIQIMLGLLRPFKLLLVDEMTVDLDVLARRNFLNFLREEAEKEKATVIYATHIYDAMDGWATHIAHMDCGKVIKVLPTDDIKTTLYNHAVEFLTQAHEERKKRLEEEKRNPKPEPPKPAFVEPFADRPNSGYTPGRMMAYFNN